MAFSYQWTRNGTAIPLATDRSYITGQLDLGQQIAVVVTGSKPGYPPALIASAPVTVRAFIDVESNHVLAAQIAWLASNKISNGWIEDDGTRTYRPTLNVSRDVMTAFMYRLAGSPAYSPPPVSPFTDVATNHTFFAVPRDVMAAFMYRFATTSSRP